MVLRSIRSRLAISFAGIALFAALALGGVLLVILQRYYSGLEQVYLIQNAKAVSNFVVTLSARDLPHDEVQAQIENLAFLTQTRIRVHDPAGRLIYDSGLPQGVSVNLGTVKQFGLQVNGEPGKDSLRIIAVNPQGDQVYTQPAPELGPGAPERKVFVYGSVQVQGSPFGFDLSVEDFPKGQAPRSSLQVTQLLRDPTTGQTLGSMTLSDGPAYGRAVLASVARGWALAGLIAILLAAAVGWLVSRVISAPILELSEATTRMAQGDLSSRARVQSQDEFGQLARSFNEMARQVETTVTTLRRFISDAAHELHTPLTALHTNLDLAMEEENAEQRLAFVGRAKAMLHRLEGLNANLLDLSRLEANGNGHAGTVFDLGEALRQRGEIYASQVEQAGLAYALVLPAASVIVHADASQILRAVDNLIDNACKFTPQGGTVNVVLEQRDGRAIVSVEDSGIGIPAEDLPQLFQRFHRGRNTTPFPGSGLGLAIVKAIAAAQGGDVSAESAGEGRGSRFSILLPVSVASRPVVDDRSARRNPSA